MILPLLIFISGSQLPDTSLAGILTPAELDGQTLKSLESAFEQKQPIPDFELLELNGSAFLVSTDILPLPQFRKANAFFQEVRALARNAKGQDSSGFLLDLNSLSNEAREAALSCFSSDYAEGIDPQADGQLAVQLSSVVTLRSGEKSLTIPWCPQSLEPAASSDFSSKKKNASGLVVKSRSMLSFPLEPRRYVLHDLTERDSMVREKHSRLWSDLFKEVGKIFDEEYSKYREDKSILRSELASIFPGAKLSPEKGKLSLKDQIYLTNYLEMNKAQFGFRSSAEVDAFVAGVSLDSQRYLLNLTQKRSDSSGQTTMRMIGIELGPGT